MRTNEPQKPEETTSNWLNNNVLFPGIFWIDVFKWWIYLKTIRVYNVSK